MKQQLGVIVAAALVGLSPCIANATERKPSSAAPAASAKKNTNPGVDATPSGETPVHRFFQAWGNGMNRGASAIGLDKDPLEGKLPRIQAKPLLGGTPRETGATAP